MTDTVAAMPVPKAVAATPFSSSAIRRSKADTVGLPAREYEYSADPADSTDSWAKVVDWWIGVRIAPVVGSGSTPAWICLVLKPMDSILAGVS